MDTFNEYQIQAFSFALPTTRNATYMGVGVANEAGELLGKLKKVLRGDKTLEETKEALLDELGDVCWYAAGIATVLGVDLSSVAQANLDKLKSRQDRGTLQGEGDKR